MWQLCVLALASAAMPPGDQGDAAAERARAVLAERLQVEAETIEVLEVEPAEWPDAALGCPEKGKVYAQVLTSGYRVQLGHEGREHWAHVADKRVVFCDSLPRSSRDTSLFQTVARVSEEARGDLAERLGIEEDAVKVEAVRPAPAATDLSGCPSPGVDESSRGSNTLLVTLRVRGTVHRYRSDGDQLTYCGTP